MELALPSYTTLSQEPGMDERLQRPEQDFTYRQFPLHVRSFLLSCVVRSLGASFKTSKDPATRQEFFDTRSLYMHTRVKGFKVIASVYGKGRHELITINLFRPASVLLQHSIHPQDLADPGLLSMNGNVNPDTMRMMEILSHRQVGRLAGEYSLGVVRYYSDPEKNQLAVTEIKQLMDCAFSTSRKTRVITARLQNDDRHWQLVILDVAGGINSPRLKIINSINLMFNMSLNDIQKSYHQGIGATLSDCLVAQGGKALRSSDIEYMQGLQYGNQGCPIATDLNYRRYVEGKFTDDQVFREGDVVINTVMKQVDLGDGEILELPESVVDKEKSLDRSMRFTQEQEASHRFQIATELFLDTFLAS